MYYAIRNLLLGIFWQKYSYVPEVHDLNMCFNLHFHVLSNTLFTQLTDALE